MALLASAARVPRPAPLPWGTIVRHAHFDSNAFVQRLEKAGITRQQADVLVTALTDVINESAENIARGLVRRDEAERLNYTQKVDFAKLKSEIQLLERSDFVLMKSENERLMADVEKLKQRLREEIARTTAGVRLDLNLEKGRIRDESSVHALKIKEVDTRIESEIAGVRTSIQSAKFNVLQVRGSDLHSTSSVSPPVRALCSLPTCACSVSGAHLFCTWIVTIRTSLGHRPSRPGTWVAVEARSSLPPCLLRPVARVSLRIPSTSPMVWTSRRFCRGPWTSSKSGSAKCRQRACRSPRR